MAKLKKEYSCFLLNVNIIYTHYIDNGDKQIMSIRACINIDKYQCLHKFALVFLIKFVLLNLYRLNIVN